MNEEDLWSLPGEDPVSDEDHETFKRRVARDIAARKAGFRDAADEAFRRDVAREMEARRAGFRDAAHREALREAARAREAHEAAQETDREDPEAARRREALISTFGLREVLRAEALAHQREAHEAHRQATKMPKGTKIAWGVTIVLFLVITGMMWEILDGVASALLLVIAFIIFGGLIWLLLGIFGVKDDGGPEPPVFGDPN